MGTDRMKRNAGFTLVETLIAASLLLVVAGSVLAVVRPSAATARALPSAIDVQQRARTAADVLFRDLYAAGAGLDLGPQTAGLVRYFAPVIPRRMGLTGADAYTVTRADAITLIWIPESSSQTTTSAPLMAVPADLQVATEPGCPVGLSICGLTTGSDAVVFDTIGRFDLFTVTSTTGPVAHLRHHDPGSSAAYGSGAFVAETMTRTYYFDSSAHQLRQSDGYLTDAPVVDQVASLVFEYFGESSPPTLPKPPVGTANCLYDAAGDPMPGLVTLPTGSGGLSPLPLGMLSDGPWCGANNLRYDADLLRIRRVRVTLRIQSTPDFVVSFDVTPRNMDPVRLP